MILFLLCFLLLIDFIFKRAEANSFVRKYFIKLTSAKIFVIKSSMCILYSKLFIVMPDILFCFSNNAF